MSYFVVRYEMVADSPSEVTLMTSLSHQCVKWLGATRDLTPDEVEVVEYSVAAMAQTSATCIGILLVGWALGILPQSVTAAVFAATLRFVTGGAHFSKPSTCTLMSIGMAVALGALATVVSLGLPAMALMATFSVALVIALAPIDSENNPLSPERRSTLKPVGRLLAAGLSVVACALFTRSEPLGLSAMLGIVLQSFSLTPTGGIWYRYIDHLSDELRNGFEGGR